jgi:hypothetical protein
MATQYRPGMRVEARDGETGIVEDVLVDMDATRHQK